MLNTEIDGDAGSESAETAETAAGHDRRDRRRRRNRLAGIAAVVVLLGVAGWALTRETERPTTVDDEPAEAAGGGFGAFDGGFDGGEPPVDVEFWAVSEDAVPTRQVAVSDRGVVMVEDGVLRVQDPGTGLDWQVEVDAATPVATDGAQVWWVDGDDLVAADLATGEQRSRVALDLGGTDPALMGAGPDGVWVVSETTGGRGEVRFVAGGALSGSWSVPGGVSDLATVEGQAWLRTDRDFGFTVWRATVDDGALVEVDIGASTHRTIEVAPDGTVWTWSVEGLVRVDPATLEVTQLDANVEGAGGVAPDLAWHDGQLYLLHVEQLYRLREDGQVAEVGRAPAALTLERAGDSLWFVVQRWETDRSSGRGAVAVQRVLLD